ncbi:endonuclease NucS [Paenibacillus validus]|uniref:endonuclease NucS domain-containing protein n=1 Tax=Paenibacillus validus TaxID=44253 RepID=UPI000FD91699|nr:endonuclease NucS domain-containing protein [Paenibacillus validus]MED4601245.1 endonuclease NucS [Paenibacillus validus]MED4607505.1 endonuclease NucS [Paenibacillus validus]
MDEIQLHDILIANSDLIEEQLEFISKEVRIGSYRCDLLFKDRNGKQLYVEVKLKVDDRAVGQILRYAGLVNDENVRFMLAGLTFVHGLKEGLTKHGYEYREIQLTDREFSNTIKRPSLSRGESKFNSPDEVIASFSSSAIQMIARNIFNYVDQTLVTYYYISDGIMFVRKGRKHKFLSISTVGNRLLIHVPVKKRDEIFKLFQSNIKIYLPIDKRDKNQIDIKLDQIVSLESLIPLIQTAYEERE